MARLIDADKIPYEECYVPDSDIRWGYIKALIAEKAVIDQIPTVDAVPVVRCKDCRHSVMDQVANELWCNHCKGLSSVLQDNDFCSYGERRLNETD